MSKQSEVEWRHPKFPYGGHLVNVGTVRTDLGNFWFRVEVCQVNDQFHWAIFAVSRVLELRVHEGHSDRFVGFHEVVEAIERALDEEKKRILLYTTKDQKVG